MIRKTLAIVTRAFFNLGSLRIVKRLLWKEIKKVFFHLSFCFFCIWGDIVCRIQSTDYFLSIESSIP